MQKLNAPDYLQKVLSADLERLCQAGFPFYAYAVLCQAIELVGNLFDTTHDFDKKGESEVRFRRGLKEIYVNQKYAKAKKDFYGGLRGTLIHQLRPGDGFILGSATHGADVDKHLTEDGEGQIILIVEELISEFKDRLKVIFAENSKHKGMLNQSKMSEVFIVTSQAGKVEPHTAANFSHQASHVLTYESSQHCYTYKKPGEC